MTKHKIESYPIHLGLGARAVKQPEFTGGMAWYETYATRNAQDGAEGRLISQFTFDTSWDSWEMHPKGDEVVLCITGEITLIQEFEDGAEVRVHLMPGEYAINKPGVWHTADVSQPTTVLFITAGEGTQHRPR